MKISLILATINRTEEVARFLKSLAAQNYNNFELIVVDQNMDKRLDALIDEYSKIFPLIHIRTDQPGLSRARNVGLAHVSGDIVAFPDDDCWYGEATLKFVAEYLSRFPKIDGITGKFTNEDGVMEGRWRTTESLLTKYNVWISAVSFSIFLNRRVVSLTGNFNESLGVGAGTPWGAGEETDYLLRSLKNGFKIRFLPDMIIFHPVKTARLDQASIIRQKKYEAGFAYVIRSNDYPFWYFPFICLRTTMGISLAFFKGDFLRAKFKASSLIARINGWHSCTKLLAAPRSSK